MVRRRAFVYLRKSAGLVRLMKSPDAVKDQTYFLSNLKQSQLTNAMFPIGGYKKHRFCPRSHTRIASSIP